MIKFVVHIGSLALTALIILAVCLLIQPLIYRTFPSDYNRHIVLNDYLTPEVNSDIIIFGDSRTMFSLDASIIKRTLGLSKEVYNLSSVGQGIFESSYYYCKVPDSTKVVLQCVSPALFNKDQKPSLQETKAISMFLSGYELDMCTAQLLGEYNEFFEKSKITQLYQSCSAFKSYIHQIIRPLLDNEVFNEEARLSPYFPHTYTKDKHPNYPFYKGGCENFTPQEYPLSQVEHIKNVRSFFEKRGVMYVLVMMPINPDECPDTDALVEKYCELIRKETSCRVLNFATALSSSEFYDLIHSNKRGAQKLSTMLADSLRGIIN